MKVLVTGSGGFIGKHLVCYLKNKHINVISYDLCQGYDLFDKKSLDESMKKADHIVHLAAVGDVYLAEKYPQKTLKMGILGTQKLIESANKYSIKKLIYISTWEVYGKSQYQPIDEEHPTNPVHPYSIAKLGGELLVKSVFNKSPWLVLRLGSVYGAEMRPYAVIPLFINKARKKEPIILHGGGHQLRQFIHINDVCNTIYICLIKSVINETINVVSNKTISIKKIAQIITKIAPTEIITGDKRLGDAVSSVVDNKKIKKLLLWKEKEDIEKEIVEFTKMSFKPYLKKYFHTSLSSLSKRIDKRLF